MLELLTFAGMSFELLAWCDKELSVSGESIWKEKCYNYNGEGAVMMFPCGEGIVRVEMWH